MMSSWRESLVGCPKGGSFSEGSLLKSVLSEETCEHGRKEFTSEKCVAKEIMV